MSKAITAWWYWLYAHAWWWPHHRTGESICPAFFFSLFFIKKLFQNPLICFSPHFNSSCSFSQVKSIFDLRKWTIQKCFLHENDLQSSRKYACKNNLKIMPKRVLSFLSVQLGSFHCIAASKPHIHLWTCLPSCPLRLWFELCVFPGGGFFDCNCLPFPLSVLPLKSLFTSSAFKVRFVTDWFPSVVLGLLWPSVSTFAVSIASLVGAYRLNHCCKRKLSN